MKMEIKECKLNEKGQCTAYLKPCAKIDDCASKLLMKKGLSLEEISVLSLFSAEKTKKDGDIETFNNINRLEVINHSDEGTLGRIFNFRGSDLTIECQLQDGLKSLKIFISK
jgi:hypothetical protein